MPKPKPEWLALLEAQLKEFPRQNIYTLATTEHGQPRVRHVVHRGVSPSGLLLSTTDTRMPKLAQIAQQPAVEAAWLFQTSLVQFRIRGDAFAVGPDGMPSTGAPVDADSPEAAAAWWADERARLFQSGIGDYLRATFARPAPPGSLLADAPPPDTWPAAVPPEATTPEQHAALELARAHFAVLAIVPRRVEILELRTSPHRRREWVLGSEGWVQTDLVP
ncbi:uncharacterized protein LOC62_07G009417 [Vanrija pseudolonga]|uniref:Pyridoxamine 5'-phosphate oxidase Alr4036 family FMN-binding domain-containing protein n=1 Tax=Vanrija pseudolonga TaxID=143232 RepID=A0AAF1BLI8_9TREE|nr:hypothetical protein LOC62_07G009417 [Vanrija pseudolonga]